MGRNNALLKFTLFHLIPNCLNSVLSAVRPASLDNNFEWYEVNMVCVRILNIYFECYGQPNLQEGPANVLLTSQGTSQ